MSSLQQVLDQVNNALKEPVKWEELEAAMLDLGDKLAEPKWAIEDETLRDEVQELLVQMAATAYLRADHTEGA